MSTLPRNHIGLPRSADTPKPAERNFVIPPPPTSVNENIFSNELGDRTLAEIQATIGACRRACEAARAGALGCLGNESLPVPQRHVVAAEHSHKCIAPALANVDRMEARLAAEIGALQKKTAAPAPTRDLLAGEVRKRLSEMPAGERMKTITRTIRDGDDLLAGSILAGPAFLSGLTQNEFDHVREVWRRTRLSDDCGRIDLLQQRQVDLKRAGDLTLKFGFQCADQAVVQATKESAKRAAAAMAQASAGLH